MASKPQNALSEIRFEHKELNELGSELARLGQEVEKAQQAHKDVLAKTLQVFLDNISKIEGVIRSKRFEHEHTLQSWHGDLEKEKAARGGNLPFDLDSLLTRIVAAEAKVESIRSQIESELNHERTVISSIPGGSSVSPDILLFLKREESGILAQKIKWDALDKELEDEYTVVDKLVMSTNVISTVLRNYQNASKFMSDVVNAKGAFEGLDESARRGVLLRVLDAKGEHMWAHDLLTNPSLAVAVRQFIGGPNASSWILPLNTVQRGSISRISWESALADIKNGNASYGYPREYFETRLYAEKSKDPEYVKFVKEAWSDWDWTNIAFEWDGGRKLTILWYERGSKEVKRVPVDDYDWKEENKLSHSMPSQVLALWGSALDRAIQADTYIWLRKGVRPVARGLSSGDYYWSLGASYDGVVVGVGSLSAVPRRVGVGKKNLQ